MIWRRRKRYRHLVTTKIDDWRLFIEATVLVERFAERRSVRFETRDESKALAWRAAERRLGFFPRWHCLLNPRSQAKNSPACKKRTNDIENTFLGKRRGSDILKLDWSANMVRESTNPNSRVRPRPHCRPMRIQFNSLGSRCAPDALEYCIVNGEIFKILPHVFGRLAAEHGVDFLCASPESHTVLWHIFRPWCYHWQITNSHIERLV